MSDVQEEARQDAPEAAEAAEVSVAVGELAELAMTAVDGDGVGLEQLLELPVQVRVEVGRARVSLGELTRLGPGSVLELDREAHRPVDVLVNGKVVARGEIVTVDERYGVRVTEIV